MAAKEYNINSIDDLKRVLKPYLGVLDLNELTDMLSSDDDSDNVMASGGGNSHTRMSGVSHES